MQQQGPPIFKAWLIFVVLANVFGFLVGAIAGFAVGLILAVAGGVDPERARIACGVAGFIAALPVSYIVFQRVVSRVIIPNVWPPASESSTQPGGQRTPT